MRVTSTFTITLKAFVYLAWGLKSRKLLFHAYFAILKSCWPNNDIFGGDKEKGQEIAWRLDASCGPQTN